VTARDVLTPLFFYKRRALIAFLVPVALAIIAALLAPPVYIADTRLLILLGDDYTSRTPLGSTQPGQSFDRTQIVKAETEIMASRELAVQTVQALGVNRLYPASHGRMSLEAAAERFGKDLAIDNIPQSNVIRLSLRNPSPAVAAEALNRLVQFYLERRRGIFDQTNQASVDKQTSAITQRLAALESQIAALAGAHGFGDLQLEVTGVTNQQIALKTQLEDLNRQWADRQGRRAQLEQQQQSTPQRTELSSDFSRSPALDSLEQTLAGLQNQRRDAAQQYVDGSPMVADLDEKIARVKAQIGAAQKQEVAGSRQGLNPTWTDINQRLSVSGADLAGIARARAEAQTQLEGVSKRLAELTAVGPQYREMVRERDVLEASASDLAKRGQATRLERSLSQAEANVRVLQAAIPPLHNQAQRGLMLASGVAAGVIAAAAVVILSVALFQGMLTPNDVEQKLAVPVIMTIPFRPHGHAQQLGRVLPAYMTADDARVLDVVLKGVARESHCSVQLIGPEDGVGVTSLVLDFALLAAGDRRKILILDLDPRPDGSVTDMLKHRGAVLSPVGDGKRFIRVGKSNLFVTRLRADGASTMNEEDWDKTFTQMKANFDVVLVDAPPLSRSLSALFVAPFVNLTIAVAEAEHSRAPALLNTIERIGGAGGEVAAAIFNKRRFYLPRAIYNWL